MTQTSMGVGVALELRLEAERNGRLDEPCVHLLRKAADEIESVQKEYDTLLRSQRLYGTGPEQLKQSIDGNHTKANRIARLECVLNGMLTGFDGQPEFKDLAATIRGVLK